MSAVRNSSGNEVIDIENSLIQIAEHNNDDLRTNLTCLNYDIKFKDFLEDYLLKNLPCLIKNVGANWECTQKWIKDNTINYDYFMKNYGDLDVPVADCNAIEFNSQCKSNMKVLEFMNYLKNNANNLTSENDSQLLYLKDWHLRKTRPKDMFYEIPSYFALDWLNEYAIDNKDDDFMFVYIGPRKSWTPLHEDVYCSYSWSVNVIGRKKWILFPPGEEEKLKDSLGNLPLRFNSAIFKDIKYFEVIQEKGDAIFVPSGWHHQVENEMDTISVNHNWINACNIECVWNALQKSLKSVEHQIEEFRTTPEFTVQCQLILKSLFGMDVKQFILFICHIAKKRLGQLKGEQQMCFGKYSLGLNLIKFDLRSILRVMNLVSEHPIFPNKELLSTVNDDLLQIKRNITTTLT